MPNEMRGGLPFRLSEVEKTVSHLDGAVEEQAKQLTRLQEQIGGERGLSSSVRDLGGDIKALQDEVRASRAGFSRPEKLVLAGVIAAFFGSLLTAGSLIL
jgi:hypothetical protein